MFRAVMLSCAAGVLAILACYGRNGAQPRADLTLVDQGHVTTLDPQQASSSADMRLCGNLWEGLATHDPATLEPISGMAEMPPELSKDGLVYTFRIRADSHWSNGDRVTAADFVRGWRRAIEPGSAADYAAVLTDHIAGAAAYYAWRNQAVVRLRQLAELGAGRTLPPDELASLTAELAELGAAANLPAPGWAEIRQTFLEQHAAAREPAWKEVGIRAVRPDVLEVRLTRPTPYFLEVLLLPVMLPLHDSIELLRRGVVDGGLDDHGLLAYDTQWTRPDYHRAGYPGLITNGAYYISDWQFRRKLRLRANPQHYFAAEVACQTIDILMFEDANTAFLAYETGVVDWLVVLSVDFVDQLLRLRAEGQRPDIHVMPAFGTYFYNLNCRDELLPDGRRNPFVDARVRRAFSLAVDRVALCRSVALKGNPPCRTLIPPETIPGYPAVEGLAHDAARAARLLDQAGYVERQHFPTVTILYNTGVDHQRIAEAVGHMWKHTLGVRVELQAMEPKTFWAEKARHNFQIARGGWYGDYADPSTFLDICGSMNGNNDSAFSSREYDELLQRAAATVHPQRRLALLAEAEALLVREALPIIPLFQYTNPTAARERVRGIHFNAREIYPYRYVEVGILIRYVLKRLAHGGASLAVIYTLTFVMVISTPGNPFQASERRMPAEVIAALEARYDIDDHGRYFWQYAWGVLTRFDFGPSFQYKDWTVNHILGDALPVSLSVGFLALLLAVAVGLPVGVIGAVRRGTWIDHLGQVLAALGISLPAFVIASALLMLCGVWLRLVPVGGWGRPQDLLLPAVSLSLPFLAYIARLTRVAMLDVLSSDYVRTAVAKGLSWRQVIWRHAFPNAFLPVLSYIGPAAAYALTGSFVVERIFNVPGLGTYFVQSVQNLDRGLIMGVVLTFSAILIALNLVVDMLYAIVDPRIRMA